MRRCSSGSWPAVGFKFTDPMPRVPVPRCEEKLGATGVLPNYTDEYHAPQVASKRWSNLNLEGTPLVPTKNKSNHPYVPSRNCSANSPLSTVQFGYLYKCRIDMSFLICSQITYGGFTGLNSGSFTPSASKACCRLRTIRRVPPLLVSDSSYIRAIPYR